MKSLALIGAANKRFKKELFLSLVNSIPKNIITKEKAKTIIPGVNISTSNIGILFTPALLLIVMNKIINRIGTRIANR